MSQRMDRVNELLRQEIGALLAKEVADPRIGFATITDVETSPDLRHAKVWVSIIGQDADRKETLRALAHTMPFIRHELGKRLRIRRIPDLHVTLDDSAERGTRLMHLLDEIAAGVEPAAIQPFDESLPTPVKRLPHEGDLPDDELPEPASPEDAAKAAALVIPPAPGARRPTGKPRKAPYNPVRAKGAGKGWGAGNTKSRGKPGK